MYKKLMNKNYENIFIAIDNSTFNFCLSTATAQESINATGGDASGSAGSASYSVGQVAYQTLAGTNGSIAEGVQQAYKISCSWHEGNRIKHFAVCFS